jgi:hypothetical protein
MRLTDASSTAKGAGRWGSHASSHGNPNHLCRSTVRSKRPARQGARTSGRPCRSPRPCRHARPGRQSARRRPCCSRPPPLSQAEGTLVLGGSLATKRWPMPDSVTMMTAFCGRRRAGSRRPSARSAARRPHQDPARLSVLAASGRRVQDRGDDHGQRLGDGLQAGLQVSFKRLPARATVQPVEVQRGVRGDRERHRGPLPVRSAWPTGSLSSGWAVDAVRWPDR